jgi:hypothetical protein
MDMAPGCLSKGKSRKSYKAQEELSQFKGAFHLLIEKKPSYDIYGVHQSETCGQYKPQPSHYAAY